MLNRVANYSYKYIKGQVEIPYKPRIFMMLDADSGPDYSLITSIDDLEKIYDTNIETNTYKQARYILNCGYYLFIVRAKKCNNHISLRLHADDSDNKIILRDRYTHPEYYDWYSPTVGGRDSKTDKYKKNTYRLVIPYDKNVYIRNGSPKYDRDHYVLVNGNYISAEGYGSGSTVSTYSKGDIIIDTSKKDFIMFNTNGVFWTGILFTGNTDSNFRWTKDSRVNRDFFHKIANFVNETTSLNKATNLLGISFDTKLDWLKHRIQYLAGFKIYKESFDDDGNIVLDLYSTNPGCILSQTSFNKSYNDSLFEYTIQSQNQIGSRFIDVFSKEDSGVENITFSIRKVYTVLDEDSNNLGLYEVTINRLKDKAVIDTETFSVTFDYRRSDYIENISNLSKYVTIKYYGDKLTYYNPETAEYTIIDLCTDQYEANQYKQANIDWESQDISVCLYKQYLKWKMSLYCIDTGTVNGVTLPLKRKCSVTDSTATDFINAIDPIDLSTELVDGITDSGIANVEWHNKLIEKFSKRYCSYLFKYVPGDEELSTKDRQYISYFDGDIHAVYSDLDYPAWMLFLYIKSLGYSEYQINRDNWGNQFIYKEMKPIGYISIKCPEVPEGQEENWVGTIWQPGQIKQINGNRDVVNTTGNTTKIYKRISKNVYDWVNYSYTPKRSDLWYFIETLYMKDEENSYSEGHYIASTTGNGNTIFLDAVGNSSVDTYHAVDLDAAQYYYNGREYISRNMQLIVNQLEFESPYIKLINPMGYIVNDNYIPVGAIFGIVMQVNYVLSRVKTNTTVGDLNSAVSELSHVLGTFINGVPKVSIRDANIEDNLLTVYFAVEISFGTSSKFDISFDITVTM